MPNCPYAIEDYREMPCVKGDCDCEVCKFDEDGGMTVDYKDAKQVLKVCEKSSEKCTKDSFRWIMENSFDCQEMILKVLPYYVQRCLILEEALAGVQYDIYKENITAGDIEANIDRQVPDLKCIEGRECVIVKEAEVERLRAEINDCYKAVEKNDDAGFAGLMRDVPLYLTIEEIFGDLKEADAEVKRLQKLEKAARLVYNKQCNPCIEKKCNTCGICAFGEIKDALAGLEG